MLSFTDMLLSALPEEALSGVIGAGTKLVLKTMMSTTLWGQWFPSIKNEFKGNARSLDLRCGFSKAFMEGKL